MTENEVKRLIYNTVTDALTMEMGSDPNFPLDSTERIGYDNMKFGVPANGPWVYMATRIDDVDQIGFGNLSEGGGMFEIFGTFEAGVYTDVDTLTGDADDIARVIKESLFNMNIDGVWFQRTLSTEEGRVELEGVSYFKITVRSEFRYDRQ